MTIEVESTKACTKCGETKPLSEFHRAAKGKKGRSAQCKKCSAEADKQYRESQGDALLSKRRAYYHKTKPARRAAAALYNAEHRDEAKIRFDAWYAANSHRVIKSAASWAAANPEKSRAIKKKHKTKKRSTPQGRLESNIHRGITRGLVPGAKANTPTFKLLSFTPDELVAHIESMFTDGMSWDNYGYDGWHVDHVRPLASFSYKTPKDPEFKEAWALSNLQPLWWRDNLSKGGRWTPDKPANDNNSSESKRAA